MFVYGINRESLFLWGKDRPNEKEGDQLGILPHVTLAEAENDLRKTLDAGIEAAGIVYQLVPVLEVREVHGYKARRIKRK